MGPDELLDKAIQRLVLRRSRKNPKSVKDFLLKCIVWITMVGMSMVIQEGWKDRKRTDRCQDAFKKIFIIDTHQEMFTVSPLVALV